MWGNAETFLLEIIKLRQEQEVIDFVTPVLTVEA